MTKRPALVTLALSGAALALAYGLALGGNAGLVAPVLMIISIPTMMIALMVLGAQRDGRLGRLWLPFAAVWMLLVTAFLAVLLLPADTTVAPHILLGVPRRAAIVLYAIGMLPLIGMPFAYALTFDDFTLTESELARLRNEVRAIHAREAAPSDGIS